MASSAGKLLRLDPFCFRQFEAGAGYAGTSLASVSKEEFMARLNGWYMSHPGQEREALLQPGYAPFCKHLFVPNWIDGVEVGALEISERTLPYLRSGYQKRRESELAVLSRWFEREELRAVEGLEVPRATWLDVILYSREQIQLENEAMGAALPHDRELYESEAWDWGVISVKGQEVDHEVPMSPITMMRNALGREEGGSGVSLDRAEYDKSVLYWSHHAILQ